MQPFGQRRQVTTHVKQRQSRELFTVCANGSPNVAATGICLAAGALKKHAMKNSPTGLDPRSVRSACIRRLSLRVSSPVKTTAQDAFDDQVIGRRRRSNSDAKVDLPLRCHIEIRDHEKLLLLLAQSIEMK